MRRLSGAACCLVAVLALISACGQQHVRSSAAPSPVVSCGDAPRDQTVNLTVSDDNKTLCVRQGVGVLVILQGTPASTWAPIHASSTVLSPRPNGGLALPRGATGAYFVAVHPGTSVITSSRSVCPGAGAPPSGHAMSCDALLAYHVTVKVTK